MMSLICRLIDLRRDAVRLVPGDLLGPAAVGLADGGLQAPGHRVGVEDHPALDVARRPADGLDQRGLRAQIALLVGVEDGDQAAFGDVQALAQQVDADQHVELAEPEVADDLDALQRVDVGMQVADLHPLLVQVLGQVLGHALGERRHQHALALARGRRGTRPAGRRPGARPGGRCTSGSTSPVGRITCSTNTPPVRSSSQAAGRGRDEDRLRPHRVPLLELERPVVGARGQAEAELGQRRLALEVALEHAADLRHRDVALVDEQQRVLRDVLEQRRRRLARRPAGQVARIVLDARAGARGQDHLEVGRGALLDPLGLQQLAGAAVEPRAAPSAPP